MTSNAGDYPGQPQIGPFLTLGYMAAPLQNEILKIRFFHVRKGPNIGPEPNFHDPMTSNVGDYPGQPKSKF